jgi:hypothetical protein
MPHFDLTHIFTALGGIIAAWLGKGAVRYGMGQMRSRIGSSVGRANAHDANATNAESMILIAAQMSSQEVQELRKKIDDINERRVKEAEERGEMKGKVAILEKQQFPNDALAAPFDAFSDGAKTVQDDVLPEKPLESGDSGLEILPKSQRKKHLLTENRDEMENDNWTIPPIGEPRKPRQSSNSTKDQ